MQFVRKLLQKRKERIERRSETPQFRFFQRFTSASLIFLLFLSQTIHVDFFDRALADDIRERDIVSLIVDQDTYSALGGTLGIGGKIQKYAEDIQSYLKDTRVDIIVVPMDARPETIAAHNEKLYYEGDGGEGVSHLVGTILIGNVPIPLVSKDGKSFPSLYPYVDFDDKRFIYDEKSGIYQYKSGAPETSDVDVWHGVINPALGRTWQGSTDIDKIGQFLDKTHAFYKKQWRFVPSNTPPRVYYYDGYTESKSLSQNSLFQYLLFLQNTENVAYERFTKYLLKDLSTAMKKFATDHRDEGDEYAAEITNTPGLTIGVDTLDSSTIDTLPDIQTSRLIGTYLKRFHEIINEKTLGDAAKFVHNAGRYNSGTTVRVDHASVDMTLTDEVALRTLKDANDALESAIDRTLKEGKYARKIILFDGLEHHIVASGALTTNQANATVNNIISLLNISGTNLDDAADDIVGSIIGSILSGATTGNLGMKPPTPPPNTLYTKVYLGYFFGEKTGRIESPLQCTLALGNTTGNATYGKPVLVEANTAYDLLSTTTHVATLSGDTIPLIKAYGPSRSCFPQNAPIRTKSYWGGNSPLALFSSSGSDTIDTLYKNPPSTESLTRMSLPIFSLGGMKETKRFSPPSVSDCQPGNNYEYSLLQPYTYPVTIEGNNNDRTEMRDWPEELGRFTCVTEHQTLETIPSFSGSIADYNEGGSCLYGSLILDQQYFDGTRLVSTEQAIGNQCKQVSDSNESDNTRYENRYYHTIDSLVKHVSPTQREIMAAKENGSTPSIPVDIIRSVEFLTPKGNIAKLTYPNLFQAEGSTVPEVREWLKKISQTEWASILDRENTTTLTPIDQQVNTLIGAGSLPSSPLDWNNLISDEVILQVIQAQYALRPDPVGKYKSIIETDLSYSHEYSNNTKNPPKIPRSNDGYEIAYLGLTPLDPSKGNQNDTINSDYQNALSTLSAINFSEEEPGDANPDNRASAQCGSPDGVNIFQWPAAILCWIRSLLPPKISAGSCGPTTVSLGSDGSISSSGASARGYLFSDETSTGSLSPVGGTCEQIDFIPLSNTLVSGGESAGALILQDKDKNAIAPELHTIHASIEGGVFLDQDMKEVTDIDINTVESQIVFRYRSSGNGPMTLHFSLENNIKKDVTLSSMSVSKIQIIPQADLRVGGPGVAMTVRLVDVNGNKLSGFESVLSLDVPLSVGSISGSTVAIHDGESDVFVLTPGRIAGDHDLSLDIPGIGSIPAKIHIYPGSALYIDNELTDEDIIFHLRDRYGNIAPENLTATLKKDGQSFGSFVFRSGSLNIGRNPGLWRIDVPELVNRELRYRDESGEQIFRGISSFTTSVHSDVGTYQFLPDYNAQYTILAGDSYMKEASNILYETDPSRARSLAVTTLTMSPYREDSLFQIFPHGGYTLADSSDTALQTDVTLKGDRLMLSLYDRVDRRSILQLSYPTRGLEVSLCRTDDLSRPDCPIDRTRSSLSLLVKNEKNAFSINEGGGNITLSKYNTPRVTLSQGGISLASGVRLATRDSLSTGYLFLDILDGGEMIGSLIIHIDESRSVTLGSLDGNTSGLILSDTHAYSARQIPYGSLSSGQSGYSIIRPGNERSLDETLLGPSHIDSLSSLSEIPGVGWHDKNRLLLSYAGGDTVGEASRFYHTFTMINLGDPVSHVEKGAPGTEQYGVDRTLGHILATSSNHSIRSVSHHDMDGDGDEDIVLVYDDGFIDLLTNTSGKFRRKQMIAYLPDLSLRPLVLGDFQGDRYSDILGTDQSGSLILIDNTQRKFTRTDITTPGGSTPSGISQYKVYDMDADGRDDIVYLTEGGELGILYGTTSRGVFTKNILETSLGIRLKGDVIVSGGALRASTTPSSIPSTFSTSTGADDSVVNSEVFYPRPIYSQSDTNLLTESSSVGDITTAFSALTDSGNLNTQTATTDLYVRSEYLEAYGLKAEKTYKNTSSDTLHSGDRVEVRITLKNLGTTTARSVSYLDTIAQIFDSEGLEKYRVLYSDGRAEERRIERLSGEDYDIALTLPDIAPGSSITISYEVTALPASYGEMIVDNLERGLAGDDIYGDVGFDTSTTCGADMLIWASTANRSYERTTRTFTQAELPPGLSSRLADTDRNGIPDSIENTSTGELNTLYKGMGDGASLSPGSLFSANLDPSSRILSLGFSSRAETDIENLAQNIANGFSCGFGGGSCVAFPINFTTNMPGSAISVLGMPIVPPTPVTGIPAAIPIFSSVTFCGPFVPPTWPPCPIGAGGSFGFAPGPVRIFAGITATLAAGVAVCTGPNITPGVAINPLYPLIPTGNCVIAAKALPICKGDGSSDDGDVSGMSGLGNTRSSWNSASCNLQASLRTETTDNELRNNIISYLRNPSSAALLTVNSGLQSRGGRTTADLGGPLLRMGDGSTSGTSIDITLDTSKPLTAGNIINVKNRRIAGFPEFIMDWVARQTDEITNKLLTLPSLVIVLPKGVGDGSLSNFLEKFHAQNLSDGFADLKTKMSNSYDATLAKKQNEAQSRMTKSAPSSGYSGLDSARSGLTGLKGSLEKNLAYGEAGASSLKAAYQFIGQIPFVRIEQESVPINIPWILPSELDQYARSLDAYKNEIERAKKSWCVGKDPKACLDDKVNISLGSLASSIEANLKRIEEYKRFPEKIQKYLTWKERYIAQLLCNVEALDKMIGGWYRDNGVRFRKWAEFYVLMKAIVSTWQPLIDIFRIKDQECSVCRNERWDLKYFKFKLLSAVIPQLPIIQFPRWPDIILDLSDIRFGVVVKVPDFRFNISPIRLPALPALALPSLPNVNINLPPLPLLPEIPKLPDLPDLPSLPRISLPSLPPPPKIPKLFGAVAVVLKMLKLLAKLYCFIQKTPLVPEDYVGTLIAQRTDRQTTMPFDFLSIKFPQIAIPSIREIRVSTHVNLEFRSDFIAAFAKAAVKPINSFTTDFSNILPKKIAPDLNITNPGTINVSPRSSLENKDQLIALEGLMKPLFRELHSYADTLMDSGEFHDYMRQELIAAGMDTTSLDRMWEASRIETDRIDQAIEKDRNEKFQALKKYLDTETALVKKQRENIGELFSREKSLSSLPFGVFSTDASASNPAYKGYQATLSESITLPSRGDDSLRQMGKSLDRKISLLMASLDSSSPNSNTSTNSSYRPNYDGIYVLLGPEKKQAKLFDYTDLIDQDMRVDVTDIDRDGDDDYLYLLGGSLYVKYTDASRERRGETDTATKIIPYDSGLLPRAPDFFHESGASPGQIDISFSPARKGDRLFRLEFFDRYLEWDHVQNQSNKDSPETPRTIIDLIVDPPKELTSQFIRQSISRTISSVSDPSSFELRGQDVTVLSPGQIFSLSKGRSLFTGRSKATLSLTLTGGVSALSLDPYSQYTFPNTLSGTLTSGKAYVISPSSSTRLSYQEDMIDMPLLPDTEIIARDGGYTLYTPSLGTTTDVSGGVGYRQIHIGAERDHYNVSFSYPDGFYSARLRSLRDDRDIRAGVTLIAPQASLDRSPPVIDLPQSTRIPVYQKYTLKISDIITDMSPYTLRVDGDTSVDTDGNSITDDDFSSPDVHIDSETITFGPFDTLGIRNMLLEVSDAHGNVSREPFRIEVYAPLPQIQSISETGTLLGKLDEPIVSEPIHFFRIREATPIELLFSGALLTQVGGAFSTGNVREGSGFILSYSGGTTRFIESTGLPVTTTNLILEFVPASAKESMSLITRKDNKILFREYLLPPDSISITQSASGTRVPSLIITKDPSFSLTPAPFDDPSIPGGYYITNAEKKALILIDKRGLVYPLDSTITWKVGSSGPYLTIRAEKGGKSILTLTYKVDFFYTAKK